MVKYSPKVAAGSLQLRQNRFQTRGPREIAKRFLGVGKMVKRWSEGGQKLDKISVMVSQDSRNGVPFDEKRHELQRHCEEKRRRR